MGAGGHGHRDQHHGGHHSDYHHHEQHHHHHHEHEHGGGGGGGCGCLGALCRLVFWLVEIVFGCVFFLLCCLCGRKGVVKSQAGADMSQSFIVVGGAAPPPPPGMQTLVQVGVDPRTGAPLYSPVR